MVKSYYSKSRKRKTKLRIEGFKCETNDGLYEKLNDFHLKVYWYERKDNERNSKKEEEEDKEIDEIEQKLLQIIIW